MLIEKLQGQGLIRHSNHLVFHGIGYELTIWREGRQSSHAAAVGDDRRVEGRVEMNTTDLFTVMDSDVPLSLVLEDGRTLNFFVTNTRGRIVRAEGGTL